MSGEWDEAWVHGSLENYADNVLAHSPANALHVAFAAHLKCVAKAMRDLTWVFSHDSSPGDEEAAIRVIISPGDELNAAIDQADVAAKQLSAVLERARSGRP